MTQCIWDRYPYYLQYIAGEHIETEDKILHWRNIIFLFYFNWAICYTDQMPINWLHPVIFMQHGDFVWYMNTNVKRCVVTLIIVAWSSVVLSALMLIWFWMSNVRLHATQFICSILMAIYNDKWCDQNRRRKEQAVGHL